MLDDFSSSGSGEWDVHMRNLAMYRGNLSGLPRNEGNELGVGIPRSAQSPGPRARPHMPSVPRKHKARPQSAKVRSIVACDQPSQRLDEEFPASQGSRQRPQTAGIARQRSGEAARESNEKHGADLRRVPRPPPRRRPATVTSSQRKRAVGRPYTARAPNITINTSRAGESDSIGRHDRTELSEMRALLERLESVEAQLASRTSAVLQHVRQLEHACVLLRGTIARALATAPGHRRPAISVGRALSRSELEALVQDLRNECAMSNATIWRLRATLESSSFEGCSPAGRGGCVREGPSWAVVRVAWLEAERLRLQADLRDSRANERALHTRLEQHDPEIGWYVSPPETTELPEQETAARALAGDGIAQRLGRLEQAAAWMPDVAETASARVATAVQRLSDRVNVVGFRALRDRWVGKPVDEKGPPKVAGQQKRRKGKRVKRKKPRKKQERSSSHGAAAQDCPAAEEQEEGEPPPRKPHAAAALHWLMGAVESDEEAASGSSNEDGVEKVDFANEPNGEKRNRQEQVRNLLEADQVIRSGVHVNGVSLDVVAFREDGVACNPVATDMHQRSLMKSSSRSSSLENGEKRQTVGLQFVARLSRPNRLAVHHATEPLHLWLGSCAIDVSSEEGAPERIRTVAQDLLHRLEIADGAESSESSVGRLPLRHISIPADERPDWEALFQRRDGPPERGERMDNPLLFRGKRQLGDSFFIIDIVRPSSATPDDPGAASRPGWRRVKLGCVATPVVDSESSRPDLPVWSGSVVVELPDAPPGKSRHIEQAVAQRLVGSVRLRTEQVGDQATDSEDDHDSRAVWLYPKEHR